MKKTKSIRSMFILMMVSAILVCIAASVSYYAFVLNLIHDKEEVYVRNSIDQIVSNIQTSAEDMIRFAKMAANNSATQDFLAATEPLDRLRFYKGVSDSLFSITQDNQETAILIMEEGTSTILAPRPLLSIVDQLESLHLDRISDGGFVGLMRNTYDGINYFAYCQPILDIKYQVQPQRKIGTCVVLNPITDLQTCINRAETTPNSLFYILDASWEPVASNQSKSDAVSQALLSALRAGQMANETKQPINGSDHMILFQEVPDTGWIVVGAVPLHEINSDLSGLLTLGVVVLLLIGLLFLFWGVTIYRSIAAPVLEISSFLQGDAYTNFHKRLYLKKQNEVGVLAERINQMLDKISEMTHTILQNQSNMYELDLAKKRAELSALQSQINPHFLYNTLDCIKGYGYLLESSEIVQIVDSLSQIMRYSIKGADIVPLDTELHIIEQYLSIISIRFADRFTFTIDIPDEARQAQIPRFILQPIIENAVCHGLEPQYGPGRLKISASVNPCREMEILVWDDGCGIAPKKLAQINAQLACSDPQLLFSKESQKGLALLNIHQRIRQLFGPEYGLTIESAAGEYTLVRLRLPGNFQK